MLHNNGYSVKNKRQVRVWPTASLTYPVETNEISLSMLGRLKNWARTAKIDAVALYYCVKDPRVPWYAKAIAGFVVAYALSPIDLIPDFIPVIGLLDDVIIIPLGLLLVLKLIPPHVFEEHRISVATREGNQPVSALGAILVIFIWLIAIVFVIQFIEFKALF